MTGTAGQHLLQDEAPFHLNPTQFSAETRLPLSPATTGRAYSTKSSMRTGHAPKGKQNV